MVDRATIRAIVFLAATNKWPIRHFDITAAYLHEKYPKEHYVYTKQMPRFDGYFAHTDYIGKLEGNLYGTPPASHIYFTALTHHLITHGYSQSAVDPCLFKKSKDNKTVSVAISMDELLTTASTLEDIMELYQFLSRKYNSKDLGFPTTYLKWHITRTDEGAIHIGKGHAIRQLLAKHDMDKGNPTPSPSPPKINHESDTATPLLPSANPQLTAKS